MAFIIAIALLVTIGSILGSWYSSHFKTLQSPSHPEITFPLVQAEDLGSSRIWETFAHHGCLFVGLTEDQVDIRHKLQEQMEWFNNLSLEEKERAVPVRKAHQFDGVIFPGAENTGKVGLANKLQKEYGFNKQIGADQTLKFSKDFKDPVQLDPIFDQFVDAIFQWQQVLYQINLSLIQNAQKHFGLDKRFEGFSSELIRCLIYPHSEVEDPQDDVAMGLHTDIGLWTILSPTKTESGFEALHAVRDGKLVSVPTVDGAIIIQLADMFAALTKGKTKAMLHQVHRAIKGEYTGNHLRYNVVNFVVPAPNLHFTAEELSYTNWQLKGANGEPIGGTYRDVLATVFNKP